jgi:uncharacterized membrane protein
MPRVTVAGHSAHAIINDWPIGLLTTSFALDLLYLATKKEDFAKAGHYALVGGLITGAAAGATGAGDYTALDKQGKLKTYARIHAALGIGIVTLSALNFFARRKRQPQFSGVSLAASAAASALTIASAWYGDEMVFGLGVRVHDGHIKANDPELRLPGDEKLTEALRLNAAPGASSVSAA